MLSFVFYSWAIWRTFSRAYGVDWRMKMLQTAGTVSAFGSYTWDAGMLLNHAVPNDTQPRRANDVDRDSGTECAIRPWVQ